MPVTEDSVSRLKNGIAAGLRIIVSIRVRWFFLDPPLCSPSLSAEDSSELSEDSSVSDSESEDESSEERASPQCCHCEMLE